MNRTDKQRASIEVYCRGLAKILNDAGITRQEVYELIHAELPWSRESVKDIWRIMQNAKGYGTETSKLDTKQVGEVYEWMSLFTSSKLGIEYKFPSVEEELH